MASPAKRPRTNSAPQAALEAVAAQFGLTAAAAAVSDGADAGVGEATPGSHFELASLSKMIGTCFALEYFAKHRVSVQTPVNHLLADLGSYRVPVAEGLPKEWAERLSLEHLMSHQGLNLHYVRGVPLEEPWPGIEAYVHGNSQHNPGRVEIIFEPGSRFKYSGGGFILLQYILELHSGQSIDALLRPFLDELGLANITFDVVDAHHSHRLYVPGVQDGRPVRKRFPPLAAGAFGSLRDMQRFQECLAEAFQLPEGYRKISHATARRMLYGRDLDFDFMGCKIGVGAFVLEGHLNRFMLHQGANDGYRLLCLHCFEGPDRGKGFVLAAAGEEEAVRHNAAMARQLLRHLEVQFLDTSRWDAEMQTHGVSQENVVNQGYRRLVFSAFHPDLPEEILEKGPLDPLAPWNVMCKGTVVGVTDQRFARAENMISAHEPCFDPALFGRMGKVMDSWESVRHNFRAFDACAVELPADSRAAKCGVRFVQMSTKYHDGNEAPFVSIEVADTFPGLLPELDGSSGSNGGSGWRTLVPKLAMGPHAWRLPDLGTSSPPFRFVRVRMFPDGGFTRLGLYPEDLPEELARNFKPVDWASAPSSVRYTDPIPNVTKPLCAPFVALPEEIAERLRALQPGESVNVASAALGACIVSASDQHYSAAANVLSPRPPVSMFDALESKRSRQGLPGASADDKGVVQLVVKLAYPCVLSKLRVDFTFLVNNAPMEMCVEACESLDGEWWILVERQRVKHFSGGKWEVALDPKKSSGYLRVSCFPCGGFNRLEVFT